MKTIFTFLLLSIALTSCLAQKTALTLNLEKGQEYGQVTNYKATMSQHYDGLDIVMVMTLGGEMSYKVIAVNPSDYDMEVKYNSLNMIMEFPGGRMEFNSDNDDQHDIFSLLLSKIIGLSFNVKMAKNGKILEVKNIEPMIESIFEDFSDIPEDQLAQFKAQITKAYGAEAYKGNIEMVTAIFPDNPVEKGDKWIVKTHLESGMAAVLTTEYVFAESGSDYAVIKGNSDIQTVDKNAYIETNGMPLKYDLTGSMVSEIKVDKKTGWIIEANINQEISGDAYIKENPQLPEGMKIPMVMKNELKITKE